MWIQKYDGNVINVELENVKEIYIRRGEHTDECSVVVSVYNRSDVILHTSKNCADCRVIVEEFLLTIRDGVEVLRIPAILNT